jgi:hypothetical protein
MSLINLLSTGPGVFVYHLLLLLVLEVAIGIAFIEYRHTHNSDNQRFLWAFGVLIGMRLLLLLGEPLGPALIAPVLGGIELASLTLASWAFLARFLTPAASTRFLIGGLGATLLCTTTFLPGWYRALARFPHLLYLTFWQQPFWYAVSTLLAVALALILLRFSWQERQLSTVLAFGALAFGFLTLCVGSLFLTVGWSDMSAYTMIGVGRLINMLGYPLFAIAVHQVTTQGKPVYPEHTLEIDGEISYRTIPFHVPVESGQFDGQPPSLDTTLGRIVKDTAEALSADVCAILLVDPRNPASVNLAAHYTYPQCTEQATLQGTSSIAEQPAIAYALKRRKQLVVNAGADHSGLETLYELLDSQESGPTIVQPILRGNRALGVLVVGNNYTRRAFEPKAIQSCRAIAEQIAAVL